MHIKTVAIMLVISLVKITNSWAKELPPILDYFPGCDYQKVALLSERGVVSTSDGNKHYQENLASILLKLRDSAAAKGADAVILTDLSVVKRNAVGQLTNTLKNSVYQYSADAIKLCQTESESLRQPAPFNHLGEKTHITKIITHMVFADEIQEMSLLTSFLDGQDISPSEFNHQPPIENKNFSLKGDFYGLSLGDSRAKVIEKLGYPSAEFTIFEGVESLLYGRRHWLHFKLDKLIGVEFTDKILSYDSLNLIEAKDEFDRFEWRVEQKIKNNSSIEEVRQVFQHEPLTEKDDVVKVTENNVQLSLVFDTEYDPFNSATKKILVGFSLFLVKFQLADAELSKSSKINLTDIINSSMAGQTPDLASLKSSLSTPVGRLFTDDRDYYDIYDNHLMVKYTNKEISELNMREEIFKRPRINFPKGFWKLADHLYQGQSAENIHDVFKHDFIAILGKATIEYPHMQIELLLDGDDEMARLYATDLIF